MADAERSKTLTWQRSQLIARLESGGCASVMSKAQTDENVGSQFFVGFALSTDDEQQGVALLCS